MSVTARDNLTNEFDTILDNFENSSSTPPPQPSEDKPVVSPFLPYYMYGVGIFGWSILVLLAVLDISSFTRIFTPQYTNQLASFSLMLLTAIICNYSLFKVPPGIWLTTSMVFYFAAFMAYEPLTAGILTAVASVYAEVFVLRRDFKYIMRTSGMHILGTVCANLVFQLFVSNKDITDFGLPFLLGSLLGFAVYRLINDIGTNVTQILQGFNFWENFTNGFLFTNFTYLAFVPASMIIAYLKIEAGILPFALASSIVAIIALVLRNFTKIQERSQAQLLEVSKLNFELNRQNDRQVMLGNRINEALDSFLSLVRSYAATSHEQETAVVEITSTVEELSRTAASIAGSADQVSLDASQAIDATANGQKAVEDTIQAIQEVRDRMEQIAVRIGELNEKADKIGGIVTTINAIAGEIRLLALNATIEASGAGQYGRRFAVVAGEVNELADRSRRSVLEIRQLISEIQAATENTVRVTQEGMRQMEHTVATVSTSDNSNREIIKVVRQTAQAASAISLATQQQRSASEQVVTNMHDVAIMIGQNAEKVASVSVASLELQRVARELIEEK
jgi:methyl-accepting chemotaxis protein